MRKFARSPAFYLCLVILAYGALLLPSIERHGMSWDEQVDLGIARSYLAGPGAWLTGSSEDPSQTRLPMTIVAVTFRVLGSDSLPIARLVSFGMGVLTLVGVYVYTRRVHGPRTALAACLLLATSPFFLSFSTTAFTESDVYLACMFAWLLVCVSRLQDERSLGWAASCALVLGLAISSKFTAVFALPALCLVVLFDPRQSASREPLPRRELRIGLGLLLLAFVVALGGWLVAPPQQPQAPALGFRHLHVGMTLLCFSAVLLWAVSRRRYGLRPLPLTCFVVSLALLSFLILPPVHLSNPAILEGLLFRFDTEMQLRTGSTANAIALHLQSIVFKSGPVIGLWLLGGIAVSAMQVRRQAALRFPVALVLFYFAGVVTLPLAQTFYMVPLLPVLAILAAHQFFELYSRWRLPAVSAGAVAVVALIVDLVLCQPDYGLNGYQWLGDRDLTGRPAMGYRGVVQTTSDGVEQAGAWLVANVEPGEAVVGYLNAWHVLSAAIPVRDFKLFDGKQHRLRVDPDYVVIHLNYEVLQEDLPRTPKQELLRRPYHLARSGDAYEKVFSVQRAFGIEVASVWKRR